MQTEIEVKFLNVDFDMIRAKLIGLGAVCEQPMRLMRRVAFDYPDLRLNNKNAFLRVRDEGDKVTMTYKQYDELSVDGTKEIEITVDSYEKAVSICETIGLKAKTIQETRRETWHLGNVEVVLDEWPWLNPYIEIEGATKEALQSVAERLGLVWSDGVFGDVMTAYRAQYPHLGPNDTIGFVPLVRFGDPLPELMQDA